MQVIQVSHPQKPTASHALVGCSTISYSLSDHPLMLPLPKPLYYSHRRPESGHVRIGLLLQNTQTVTALLQQRKTACNEVHGALRCSWGTAQGRRCRGSHARSPTVPKMFSTTVSLKSFTIITGEVPNNPVRLRVTTHK